MKRMGFTITVYSKSELTQDAATPTVPAQLAHDCLNSVPLGKESALEFVEALEPYIEFQSGKHCHSFRAKSCQFIRLGRVRENRSQKYIQIQTFRC
jgi:hypothetical protein